MSNGVNVVQGVSDHHLSPTNVIEELNRKVYYFSTPQRAESPSSQEKLENSEWLGKEICQLIDQGDLKDVDDAIAVFDKVFSFDHSSTLEEFATDIKEGAIFGWTISSETYVRDEPSAKMEEFMEQYRKKDGGRKIAYTFCSYFNNDFPAETKHNLILTAERLYKEKIVDGGDVKPIKLGLFEIYRDIPYVNHLWSLLVMFDTVVFVHASPDKD